MRYVYNEAAYLVLTKYCEHRITISNYICTMKRMLWAILLIGVLGCSEYQKVLKSGDLEYKYEKALEYYNEDDYYRALSLLEELVTLMRGSGKSEEIYYYYAYCHYYQKDYILAAYHFKKFTMNFPNSEKVEECLFMAARCHYLNSPPYSLDQTDTKKAIKELTLFVNNFHESELVDSCNTLIDNLRAKLEKKDYAIANLYFKTENYKAAITSLGNFINKYPDSDRVEEAKYTILKSYYIVTRNSVDKKKLDRINETIEAYLNFVDAFPNSKVLSDAEQIYKQVMMEKEQIERNN